MGKLQPQLRPGVGNRIAMGRRGPEARGAPHCVWSHPGQIDDIEGVTALSPSMWDY